MGKRPRTGAAHLEQPARAVGAHARENHPDGALAGCAGDGLEQHVDRRAMQSRGWFVPEASNESAIFGDDPQMTSARSDQCDALLQLVAVFGLADPNAASGVQSESELAVNAAGMC